MGITKKMRVERRSEMRHSLRQPVTFCFTICISFNSEIPPLDVQGFLHMMGTKQSLHSDKSYFLSSNNSLL